MTFTPPRNIKFRFWNTTTQTMLDNDWLLLQDWSYKDLLECDNDLVRMQYSEIMDINGIEIYENDIVKVPDDWELYGMNAGEVYVVYFGFGGFRLRPKRNSDAKGHYLEDGADFEVIGDIFRNQNLLESA